MEGVSGKRERQKGKRRALQGGGEKMAGMEINKVKNEKRRRIKYMVASWWHLKRPCIKVMVLTHRYE